MSFPLFFFLPCNCFSGGVTPTHSAATPDIAMQITRRFTHEGQDPFVNITFAPRTSVIRNPNGSVVFEMKDVMVPSGWSQVAVDILAQKYFRRAGLPDRLERVHEEGVPT